MSNQLSNDGMFDFAEIRFLGEPLEGDKLLFVAAIGGGFEKVADAVPSGPMTPLIACIAVVAVCAYLARASASSKAAE